MGVTLITFKRNPDIIWRTEIEDQEVQDRAANDRNVLEEGTVILAEDDMIHQLNFVGGKIWTLADGKRTTEDITEELLNFLDVDKAELLQDVEEFVNGLIARNWLLPQESKD